MTWGDFLDRLGRGSEAGAEPRDVSRRDMLRGLGLVAAGIVAGPALLLPDRAGAAETGGGISGAIEEVQYRRGRGRAPGRGRGRGRGHARRPRGPRYGHRPRYVPRRHRPRSHFRFDFHYAPRRRHVPRPRYSGNYEYWHRQCARNWGYNNANYYGCMRYHGFL